MLALFFFLNEFSTNSTLSNLIGIFFRILGIFLKDNFGIIFGFISFTFLHSSADSLALV